MQFKRSETTRLLGTLPLQIIAMLLLLSLVSCVRLCVTPQMAAHQVPLSLGFSRQEYWSGLTGSLDLNIKTQNFSIYLDNNILMLIDYDASPFLESIY